MIGAVISPTVVMIHPQPFSIASSIIPFQMLSIFLTFGILGFLSLLGRFVDIRVGTKFSAFVEDKFGAFPHFAVFVVLEWFEIVFIYLDGFTSFFSNEISRLFERKFPCLLCTRIDHVLSQGSSHLYNESICEAHKKFLSSLAYCNTHKKLADSRTMCQGCLLSFDTEKESEFDTYNYSLVGILNKEDEETKMVSDDENGNLRCSCCGEPLASRASSKYKRNVSITSRAPAPSPRAPLDTDTNSELPEDGDDPSTDTYGRMDAKANRTPLLSDSDDNNESITRTSSFTKLSKFMGTQLSRSSSAVQLSQQVMKKVGSRKLSVDRLDSMADSVDDADSDLLARLKKQISLNRKSLKALYKELDQERSASSVAAKNALAMISRLQAEKAAVQMEALQYQRMKEEQADYDKEALETMRELLWKRDEELKALEVEVEMYRVKYGEIKEIGSEICEVDEQEDYQDIKPPASEKGAEQNVMENSYENMDELAVDYEGERSHLLGLLKNLEGNGNGEDEGAKLEEDESKASGVQNAKFTRELSLMRERLRVIEADSGFLKHTAVTQGEGEGTKLLTEIAEHVRSFRHSDNPEKSQEDITDD